MSAPFDTLKLADRLGAGGFTSEQAHTAASALSDALAVDMATKADVETAKLQLEARIQEVATNIQEVRAELIKRFLGMAGFQTLVILGAKLFIK